jgi:hypothetical protein
LGVASDVFSEGSELADDESHVPVALVEALVDFFEAQVDLREPLVHLATELVELAAGGARLHGLEHELHLADHLLIDLLIAVRDRRWGDAGQGLARADVSTREG